MSDAGTHTSLNLYNPHSYPFTAIQLKIFRTEPITS